MHSLNLLIGSIGLFLTTSSLAAPLARRDITGPVITSDFPDPSIIKVGNTWYAFGTQSLYDNTEINIQLATSNDFFTWSLRQGYDALASLPSWADKNAHATWAPDVFERDDGSFVMYFSAAVAGNARYHCFGAATSNSIEGPYNPTSDQPIACPTDQGGAIDAASFRDSDGTRYITYKIDGNANGSGGFCNNGDGAQSTPIMLQKVQEDGISLIDGPVQILDRGAADGPLVEAPAMVKIDGNYVLYFSSQCYTSDRYDTSYATSSSPYGPFTKAARPLLESFNTSNKGYYGPGGTDADADGSHIAFHAYNGLGAIGNRRSMYVATVGYNAGTKVASV